AKYPKGFDINSEDNLRNGENICAMASIDCDVIQVKRFEVSTDLHKWVDEYNLNCKSTEFKNKMNNFCISLGDCGGYVNIDGKYTKNFKTSGKAPGGDLEASIIDEYESYASSEEGDFPKFISMAETDGADERDISPEGIYLPDGVGWHAFAAGLTIWAGANVALWALAVTNFWNPVGWIAAAIDIILILAWLIAWLGNIFGYGATRPRSAGFECLPWQPPIGGDDCEECNKDPLKICTEYRCKSLGQACGRIEENTDRPLCIDKYDGDDIPPT
ncbi:unnamed protein product, partial [marine sediment metagenome]